MAQPAEGYPAGGPAPAAAAGRRSRVPARLIVGPTSAVVTEVNDWADASLLLFHEPIRLDLLELDHVMSPAFYDGLSGWKTGLFYKWFKAYFHPLVSHQLQIFATVLLPAIARYRGQGPRCQDKPRGSSFHAPLDFQQAGAGSPPAEAVQSCCQPRHPGTVLARAAAGGERPARVYQGASDVHHGAPGAGRDGAAACDPRVLLRGGVATAGAQGVVGPPGEAAPVEAAAVDAGGAARVGVPRPGGRLPSVSAPHHPLPPRVLLVLLLRQRGGQAAPAH